MKRIAVLVIIMLFTTRCYSPKKKAGEGEETSNKNTNELVYEANDYFIEVTILNNSLKVLVDDSLVYQSKAMPGHLKDEIVVDLAPYIIDETETIKIELYNGFEPYDDQTDEHWEIRYDLVIQGELVDFVHESSRNGVIGKAFEMSYTINEWSFDE